MTTFRRSDLTRFWPQADVDWLTCFIERSEAFGERYHVNTMQRWRHFLAQISAETGGLVCNGRNGSCLPGMVENLNYRPSSLLAANGYRVRKAQRDIPQFQRMSLNDVADALCGDHKLLAETVYGGRKDIGNVNEGDGWKYIGRDPMQTTGREAYAKIARLIGVDCVSQPELLQQPIHGWEAAFADWDDLGCNELADAGNVDKVSRRVNGGDNGLSERRAWLRKAEAIWPDDTMAPLDVPSQTATSSDLVDMGSRSASSTDMLQKGAVATATAGALAKLADQATEFTSNIDALKGVGDAVHGLVGWVEGHALVALVIGAVLVAYCSSGILARMVENFRSGRYVPSGK